MKYKVTSWISFLGALGWGGTLFFFIVKDKAHGIQLSELLLFSTFLVCQICTILFVFWTGFGNSFASMSKKLDLENEILKKQIEQKALKKELEN
ncbi:MAG: hypothetical protein RIB71_11005 [Imperialibacter sp.]|uniref:hypothetical protein n=1 Tax=Imperialibacter sp. TaxID=2038411 RepID=UPI0032F020C7